METTSQASEPRRAAGVPQISWDQATKAIASVAVVCYVLGLFVVNLYLLDLGVADFALLRPQFVLAGALALVPISLTVPPYFICYRIIVEHSEAPKTASLGPWWRDRSVLFLVALSAVFSVLPTKVAMNYLTGDHSFSHGWWLVLVLQAPIAALAAYTIVDLPDWRRVRTDWQRSRTEGLTRLAFRTFQGFWSIATVGFYLAAFSREAFPLIPVQAGGGRPIDARLVIDSSSAQEAQQAGIAVTDGNLLSPPVALLWEGDDFYVVRLRGNDGDRVVRIGKGSVSAVVLEDTGSTPSAPNDATPEAQATPTSESPSP